MATPLNEVSKQPAGRQAGASRAGQRLRTLAVAIGTFGALLAGWKALGDRVTPAASLPMTEIDRLRWVSAGVGPVHLVGDADPDDVLFLGDSRTDAGIVHAAFERTGLGDATVLWGGGVELTVLLEEALKLPPRRVVVCLTPLSLAPPINRVSREILRAKSPVFDPQQPRSAVLRWAHEEREYLKALGDRARFADASIQPLIDRHAAMREQLHQWTSRFDHRLRNRADLLRMRLVNPVVPQRWHQEWVRAVDPQGSNRVYNKHLHPKYTKRRRAERARVIELCSALVVDGRSVALVRLPIAAELRALEDEKVPRAFMNEIPSASGLPFLDFDQPRPTSDGSHLMVEDAIEVTEELGVWLRDELGW